MATTVRAGCAGLLVAVLLAVLAAPTARGHDIPDRILLHGFVKPEGERLHFLVRVPLIMLLNIKLPKRGPGFIALQHVDAALQRAADATARGIVLYEEGDPLAYSRVRTRISQPSDDSFASFESARTALAGPPLADDVDVFWNQGYFDVHFEMPIDSAQSSFSLEMLLAPGLKERLQLALRFLPPDGEIRAYELHYGSGRVHLDPSWFQAAASFTRLGVAHILDGIDHLLFLLCLVIPFRSRDWLRLIGVVTAFTAAHTVTLITAALGYVPQGPWFPPLVETLIAASIVFVAVENVLGVGLSRRWMVTALFGLVHGFGFALALQQDLQLAGSHLLLSLVAFNVGVEIGQILFIAALLPGLALLDRFNEAQRTTVIVVSVLVGHTAWHWAAERFSELRLKPSPELDTATAVTGLGWLLLVAFVLVAVQMGARRRGLRRHREIDASARTRTVSESAPPRER